MLNSNLESLEWRIRDFINSFAERSNRTLKLTSLKKFCDNFAFRYRLLCRVKSVYRMIHGYNDSSAEEIRIYFNDHLIRLLRKSVEELLSFYVLLDTSESHDSILAVFQDTIDRLWQTTKEFYFNYNEGFALFIEVPERKSFDLLSVPSLSLGEIVSIPGVSLLVKYKVEIVKAFRKLEHELLPPKEAENKDLFELTHFIIKTAYLWPDTDVGTELFRYYIHILETILESTYRTDAEKITYNKLYSRTHKKSITRQSHDQPSDTMTFKVPRNVLIEIIELSFNDIIEISMSYKPPFEALFDIYIDFILKKTSFLEYSDIAVNKILLKIYDFQYNNSYSFKSLLSYIYVYFENTLKFSSNLYDSKIFKYCRSLEKLLSTAQIFQDDIKLLLLDVDLLFQKIRNKYSIQNYQEEKVIKSWLLSGDQYAPSENSNHIVENKYLKMVVYRLFKALTLSTLLLKLFVIDEDSLIESENDLDFGPIGSNQEVLLCIYSNVISAKESLEMTLKFFDMFGMTTSKEYDHLHAKLIGTEAFLTLKVADRNRSVSESKSRSLIEKSLIRYRKLLFEFKDNPKMRNKILKESMRILLVGYKHIAPGYLFRSLATAILYLRFCLSDLRKEFNIASSRRLLRAAKYIYFCFRAVKTEHSKLLVSKILVETTWKCEKSFRRGKKVRPRRKNIYDLIVYPTEIEISDSKGVIRIPITDITAIVRNMSSKTNCILLVNANETMTSVRMTFDIFEDREKFIKIIEPIVNLYYNEGLFDENLCIVHKAIKNQKPLETTLKKMAEFSQTDKFKTLRFKLDKDEVFSIVYTFVDLLTDIIPDSEIEKTFSILCF